MLNPIQSIPLSKPGNAFFAHVSQAATLPTRPGRKAVGSQCLQRQHDDLLPDQSPSGWQNAELVTLPAVLERLKLSRSQIYALMARDEFPRPLKVGRSARWSCRELEEWIHAKLAARKQDNAIGGGTL